MKTAVEWLFEQFVKKSCITLKDIQIAKEMEKQQIIDAYKNGIEEGIMRYSSEEYSIKYYKTDEQYYNETYKSE